MDQHRIQRVDEVLLGASCYGNRDKLWPGGTLGLYADFTFTTFTVLSFDLDRYFRKRTTRPNEGPSERNLISHWIYPLIFRKPKFPSCRAATSLCRRSGRMSLRCYLLGDWGRTRGLCSVLRSVMYTIYEYSLTSIKRPLSKVPIYLLVICCTWYLY